MEERAKLKSKWTKHISAILGDVFSCSFAISTKHGFPLSCFHYIIGTLKKYKSQTENAGRERYSAHQKITKESKSCFLVICFLFPFEISHASILSSVKKRRGGSNETLVPRIIISVLHRHRHHIIGKHYFLEVLTHKDIKRQTRANLCRVFWWVFERKEKRKGNDPNQAKKGFREWRREGLVVLHFLHHCSIVFLLTN